MRSVVSGLFFRRVAPWLAPCAMLIGCAPELNWRDVHLPQEWGARVMFPCKPRELTRAVQLAGQNVSMSMYSCQAAGATYALAVTRVEESGAVTAVLDAWKTSQVGNLSATAEPRPSMRVAAGEGQHVERRFLKGRLPDGEAVEQEVLAFSKGALLFQVTVMSARVDPAAALFFFESVQ